MLVDRVTEQDSHSLAKLLKMKKFQLHLYDKYVLFISQNLQYERDQDGSTLLHTAAKNNDHVTVELLLENYTVLSNVNARDTRGNTPLHLAAEK